MATDRRGRAVGRGYGGPRPRPWRAGPAGLLVAGLLLPVAACGPGAEPDGEAGEDATARFVAIDIDFREAPERLPDGQVTVELDNQGALAHNVTFEGVDPAPVVEAPGGQGATGTVELEPGEYAVYCSVAGHREAGMEVTVTVDG